MPMDVDVFGWSVCMLALVLAAPSGAFAATPEQDCRAARPIVAALWLDIYRGQRVVEAPPPSAAADRVMQLQWDGQPPAPDLAMRAARAAPHSFRACLAPLEPFNGAFRRQAEHQDRPSQAPIEQSVLSVGMPVIDTDGQRALIFVESGGPHLAGYWKVLHLTQDKSGEWHVVGRATLAFY